MPLPPSSPRKSNSLRPGVTHVKTRSEKNTTNSRGPFPGLKQNDSPAKSAENSPAKSADKFPHGMREELFSLTDEISGGKQSLSCAIFCYYGIKWEVYYEAFWVSSPPNHPKIRQRRMYQHSHSEAMGKCPFFPHDKWLQMERSQRQVLPTKDITALPGVISAASKKAHLQICTFPLHRQKHDILREIPAVGQPTQSHCRLSLM